ncbi:alpha/beta fold hydrolase [Diaphorobacter caeni]|uniref:alpha/beta fold hydrolase n=1 Tax=Diaphorobacter caeni TaxID=2784387 RepID=UPI00188FB597|nr:alpha/beta hydrolase [Diaphorobacter caeni]MBF5007741.1 alpha/beta hydrolase [Diaphorobacter caeni]
MNPQYGETGSVASGDVKIHYRRFAPANGAAKETPVVIVHGLSYFSYDWIGVATELAIDREVVAIDLRGFGESGWSPTRDYGLRTMAQDIVAVMDHLAWPRATLVGHSMGGRICLCTAAWYPERVEGLMCLDFAPDVEAAGRRNVALRIGNQPDFFASVDDALEYHGILGELPDSSTYLRFKAFLRPTEQGLSLKRDLHYRDQFRQVLLTGKSQPVKEDLWGMVAGLSMPAAVVRGSTSDMLSPQTLTKVREVNPRVLTTEITGSHDLPGDNPSGLIQVIGAFLRNH